jgi:hypothetical protein
VDSCPATGAGSLFQLSTIAACKGHAIALLGSAISALIISALNKMWYNITLVQINFFGSKIVAGA